VVDTFILDNKLFEKSKLIPYPANKFATTQAKSLRVQEFAIDGNRQDCDSFTAFAD